MKEQDLSKAEISCRMKTRRASRERLLNPYGQSVTMQTLDFAAAGPLGKRLQISLA